MTEEERYYEEKIVCPVCGKDAILRNIVKTIPYYGEIRIVSIRCPHCNYRFSDVYVLREDTSKKIELKIRDEKDLHAMLVLTSRARVSIPELGLEINPGPASKGRMLPVSALLMEFIDMTKFAMSNAETEEGVKQGEKIIDKLEKELESPTGELTVVVEDETGLSDIIPEDVRSRRAEEERRVSNRKERNVYLRLHIM